MQSYHEVLKQFWRIL